MTGIDSDPALSFLQSLEVAFCLNIRKFPAAVQGSRLGSLACERPVEMLVALVSPRP